MHELFPGRLKQKKISIKSFFILLTDYYFLDGQEIAHAVVMSHKTSPLVYKDDYNKNVLGQGPANPAIAFPENDRLKKIHDKTSKVKH